MSPQIFYSVSWVTLAYLSGAWYGGEITIAQAQTPERAIALPADAEIVEILLAGDEWAWGNAAACDMERVAFGADSRFITYESQEGIWDDVGSAADTFAVADGTLTYTTQYEYDDTAITMTFEAELELVAVSPNQIDGIGLSGDFYSLYNNCPDSVTHASATH